MEYQKISARYLDHMGSDLEVVNNARVSFNKCSDWEWPELKQGLKSDDARLISFLARGCSKGDWNKHIGRLGKWNPKDREALMQHLRRMPTHWAPFANGIRVKALIEAPIPIMRQVFKHKVGSEESEVSRRYDDSEPSFFMPEYRCASKNIKQGSLDEVHPKNALWQNITEELYYESARAYGRMIDAGIPAEQARFILPQGMMSKARVSMSLYGWANFYNARIDTDHAQREAATLAEQIAEICAELYPVSWISLTEQY